MEGIKNHEVYNSGMVKSLRDKLFFEGLIGDIDTIIDYGCADGSLLKQFHEDFPDVKMYGIDSDPMMIESAEENCPDAEFIYNDKLPRDLDGITMMEGETLIVLSSVLHEVLHYSSAEEIEEFWDRLWSRSHNPFKYIAIRDMMVSKCTFRPSDINDQAKIRAMCDLSVLEQFESIWGSIADQRNLIHFLLKYNYHESPNWSREIWENYLPITLEELLSMIPTNEYRIVYCSHYLLPHLGNVFRDLTGIELKDNTHIKLLLERID